MDIDLVGTITQVIPGNRVLLANGNAQILPGKLDTAFADVARGRVAQGVSTALTNNGVPFVFVDHNVRNSLRYFYSVIAFDVNSPAPVPRASSRQRATKAVTPVPLGGQPVQRRGAHDHVIGRGRAGLRHQHDAFRRSTRPPVSSAGRSPPANGGALGLVQTVSQVIGGVTAAAGAARQHRARAVGQRRHLRRLTGAVAQRLLVHRGAGHAERVHVHGARARHQRRPRRRLERQRYHG